MGIEINEKLKSTGEITIKSTNKFSIVTIVKYEDYQSNGKKSTSKSTGYQLANQPHLNKVNKENNILFEGYSHLRLIT